MQLRLLIGTLLVMIVFAIITKPFKNKAKVRELVNHMMIALCTYYGSYGLLSFTSLEPNQAISIAIGITVVVLLVVNLFFRKK
jgi:uncharacterized membrane protein